jgi:Protein of unknown function (DUF3352)
MRRAVLLLLPLLAIVAAGCGGTTTSAGAGPSGASIVPASAPVFVSVDTDLSSSQVKQADELLKKFPGRDKLLAQLNKSLADEGVNIEQVKDALGPELDIVVLDVTSNPNVVVLTQPKDEEQFVKLLAKGSDPPVHTTVAGWTVFSETQAALDAFKAAQNGDKLADKSTFTEAMGKVPDEALVKAYVDGSSLNQALQEQLQGQVPGGLGGLQKLDWLVGSLEAQDDGAALHFVANGFSQGTGDYTSELLHKAPQSALVFATFKGLGKQFENVQGVTGAAFEQALGMKLSDFAQLFSGETAIWMSAGTPIPEISVVLGGDPKQSLATLDRLASRVSTLAGGAQSKQTTVAGVPMTQVTFGGVFSVYYGEVGGKVLLTDTRRGVTEFQNGPGSSLADDPSFKRVVDASGLPDAYGGFLYANIPDTVAALSGLASAAGDAVPPDVEANLRPLRSAVLWSSAAGDSTDVQAFVEIR